jgi:hypothetical protein
VSQRGTGDCLCDRALCYRVFVLIISTAFQFMTWIRTITAAVTRRLMMGKTHEGPRLGSGGTTPVTFNCGNGILPTAKWSQFTLTSRLNGSQNSTGRFGRRKWDCNNVLRDVTKELWRLGVLYCQNVTPFHGSLATSLHALHAPSSTSHKRSAALCAGRLHRSTPGWGDV